METVVRGIVEALDDIDLAILDLTEVTEIDVSAARLLTALGAWMTEGGRTLVLVAPEDGDLLDEVPTGAIEVFTVLDTATEWCEDRLLAASDAPSAPAGRVPLAGNRLTRGLDPAVVSRLEEVVTSRPFDVGEEIFAVGDDADSIFFLVEGEVTLEIEVTGGMRRLATLTPGHAFGEIALADVPLRPVTVRAETSGECLVLSVEEFDRLGGTDPALQTGLMRNLLASFWERIGRMTREVGSLFDGR